MSLTSEARSILPIASISDAFATIARLSDGEVAALSALLTTGRSFWPPDEGIQKFCREAGLSKIDGNSILNLLRYLYDLLGDRRGDERSRAIQTLAAENREGLGDDQFASLTTRLTSLLEFSEGHEKFRKLYRLERGFLPIATHFETLVDLRPDFDEGASEVIGFIPVVSVRIKTSSPDPSLRNFSFTLPLDQVASLTKSVERMNAKLNLLKSRLATDPPVKK